MTKRISNLYYLVFELDWQLAIGNLPLLDSYIKTIDGENKPIQKCDLIAWYWQIFFFQIFINHNDQASSYRSWDILINDHNVTFNSITKSRISHSTWTVIKFSETANDVDAQCIHIKISIQWRMYGALTGFSFYFFWLLWKLSITKENGHFCALICFCSHLFSVLCIINRMIHYYSINIWKLCSVCASIGNDC